MSGNCPSRSEGFRPDRGNQGPSPRVVRDSRPRDARPVIDRNSGISTASTATSSCTTWVPHSATPAAITGSASPIPRRTGSRGRSGGRPRSGDSAIRGRTCTMAVQRTSKKPWHCTAARRQTRRGDSSSSCPRSDYASRRSSDRWRRPPRPRREASSQLAPAPAIQVAWLRSFGSLSADGDLARQIQYGWGGSGGTLSQGRSAAASYFRVRAA